MNCRKREGPDAGEILAQAGVTQAQADIWQVGEQTLLALTANTETQIRRAMDRIMELNNVTPAWGPGLHDGDWRADFWLEAKSGPDETGPDDPLREEERLNVPEDPSRAQQALENYDRNGEEALLDFLIVHRDPNPDREAARNHWERGLHVLDDHSVVEIEFDNQRYAFSWNGNRTTRPATALARTMPLPPGPNLPMLDWPNVESIARTIVHWVVPQAPGGVGLEDPQDRGGGLVLNGYQLLTLAPGLTDRIAEFVQNVYEIPDSLIYILDKEEEHCARMVLEGLPEEQRAALTKAVTAAMQTKGRE